MVSWIKQNLPSIDKYRILRENTLKPNVSFKNQRFITGEKQNIFHKGSHVNLNNCINTLINIGKMPLYNVNK